MSMVNVSSHERLQRREDFPVDTFRYLEGKLQVIRKLVMDRAAAMAEMRNDFGDFYRVEKGDIDDAFAACLDNPEEAREALGLLYPPADGGR